MIDIVAFIVLSFAAYRITRFLLFDTLLDEPRNFWYNTASGGNRFKLLREKALDLTSCSWCTGVWVTFFLYWIYVWYSPVHFTRFDWINILAIAGVQGLLHAYEPGDDD